MYVLDTNVLSHGAPSRTQPDAGVVAWLERNGQHLYLSAVTVAEIAYGVARLERRGAVRRAELLRAWLGDVLIFHGSRVLAIETEVAARAGELLAAAVAHGVEPGIEDALIAATADLRGFTVLTRNTRHFAPMGVAHMDPFVALPPEATSP